MAHAEQPRLRHVAVIMDGNGRWATRQNLPRIYGHKAGADAFERIVEYVAKATRIEYFTAYGFAINNNDRDAMEVRLINAEATMLAKRLGPKLRDHNVRVRVVGDMNDERVPNELRKAIHELVDMTSDCTKLKLQIAWNYSGENEIMRAQEAGYDVCWLYRSMFDAPDVPKIDVAIRTGVDNAAGPVIRTGDFFPLLSQGAVWDPQEQMWPDTTGEHIEQACAKWRAEKHLNGGQRPTATLVRAMA